MRPVQNDAKILSALCEPFRIHQSFTPVLSVQVLFLNSLDFGSVNVKLLLPWLAPRRRKKDDLDPCWLCRM